MKILTFLLILLSSILLGYGQKPAVGTKASIYEDDTIIAKRAVVNNFESQIKSVQLPVVRNFVRFKTASWLWQNDKDNTGDANAYALKAFEEIYEKRNEIPDGYFYDLRSHLLALFEANSLDTAKRLTEKYSLDKDEELNSAFSLLDKKNGEKLAADKLIKLLHGKSEISPESILLIEELQSRNSPELSRILSAVLNSEFGNRSNLSLESLFYFVDAFRGTALSTSVRTQFYSLILRKVKEEMNSHDADIAFAFDAVNAILADIPASEVNLITELGTLKVILSSKISKSAKEEHDIYDRIDESADRLEAMILAAETANSPALKEKLITEASNLALREKKFKISLDLGERLFDLKKAGGKEKEGRFNAWFDQFMADLAIKALKEEKVEINHRACEKISDRFIKSETLRKTALIFLERSDSSAAANALKNSLRNTNELENGPRKISLLLRLIPAFQKIDQESLSTITETTAKLINSLPTLAPEDKPESENYIKYVNSVMQVNMNLLPVFTELLNINRIEATDFASRINRNEIKIITSYVITIDNLNSIKSPIAKNEPKK